MKESVHRERQAIVPNGIKTMLKPQPIMTLTEYYKECIIMLDRQPSDYHVGAAERAIIAKCHETNRPITSAVGYIMNPKARKYFYQHYAS